MDADFDRRAGLHSLPARFGRRRAFHLALLFHAIALAAFFATGVAANLGQSYLLGLAVAAVALVSQRLLIGSTDLRRIRMSFFTMNGAVSVTLLAGTFAALAL